MKEWKNLCQYHHSLKDQSQRAVLATLIYREGTSFRMPGARMLITPDGETIASLGTCLEKDLVEHSREVFQTGQNKIISYDLTSPQEVIWGLGLGCQGKMDILLERLPAKDDPLVLLKSCLDSGEPGLLATVVRTKGLPEIEVGKHWILAPRRPESSLPANLIEQMAQDCRDLTLARRWKWMSYSMGAGRIQVLLELIQPFSLVILGAHPIATPLIQMAHLLGWQIRLVDHRPFYAQPERFPLADEVLLCPWDKIENHLKLPSHTALVILTHHYLTDQKLLKLLLPAPLLYLGMLSSRKRRDRLLSELKAQGLLDESHISKLHCPLGLDTGGDSPQEIALSCMAEIQAVIHQRSGVHLRTLQQSIHPREKS